MEDKTFWDTEAEGIEATRKMLDILFVNGGSDGEALIKVKELEGARRIIVCLRSTAPGHPFVPVWDTDEDIWAMFR